MIRIEKGREGVREAHAEQRRPPVRCASADEAEAALSRGRVAEVSPEVARVLGAVRDDNAPALDEVAAGDGLLVDAGGGFAGER